MFLFLSLISCNYFRVIPILLRSKGTKQNFPGTDAFDPYWSATNGQASPMSHDADEAIPPHLIHDALQRVIGSQEFSTSERKKRFLKYIVQETLAGHADRIKAYTIAVDVFDRDPSFDPASDPVVRIEAGRLRRCLEHYYLAEGSADRIRITIPKGGYVPQFILRKETEPSVPQVLRDDERLNAGRMSAIIPVEAAADQAPAVAPSSSPPLRASFQKRSRVSGEFLLPLGRADHRSAGGRPFCSSTGLREMAGQPPNRAHPSWFCRLRMTAATRRRTSLSRASPKT